MQTNVFASDLIAEALYQDAEQQLGERSPNYVIGYLTSVLEHAIRDGYEPSTLPGGLS